MILATTESVQGKRIVEVKGLVQGNTIRARHLGRDIMAGLRNIVGGEISEYTRLMTESRMQSTRRMIDEAEGLGANAVVGVRFVTSMVMSGASELLAYGTAVVVEDESQEQAESEDTPPPSRSVASLVGLAGLEPNGVCWCGCGGSTQRLFMPGHDGKFRSAIRKYESGELAFDELPSTIRGLLEETGGAPDESSGPASTG